MISIRLIPNEMKEQITNTTCNKAYKLLVRCDELYDWDYGYNFIKGLPRYKRRSYKTWKHTRQTQWK